jgi:hypothetical protein
MAEEQQGAEYTTQALAEYLDGYFSCTWLTLHRVVVLIDLAQAPQNEAGEPVGIHRQDLLRAAVVLLHATVEEFLRYVGTLYLPHSPEEVLNSVSILGSEDPLRPEKFYLGRLVRHRGKTVEQLIEQSVAAHLERMTFSNTSVLSHQFVA